MSLAIRNTLSPTIAQRAAVIADKRPILEAMGLEFRSLTERDFTDAALRPAPWAPLKPETLKRKKGSILRESGHMWQSFHGPMAITNDSVTVSATVPYAAIQQLGGRTGRNHAATVPPRPFFPILDGKLTAHAQERIEAVARAKIKSLTK